MIRDIDSHIIQLLTPDQAWYYKVIPFEKTNGSIKVYQASGAGDFRDEVELLLDTKLEPFTVEPDEIEELLNKYYRKPIDKRANSTSFLDNDSDYVDQLIREAQALKSSDIHLEPLESKTIIRFRIDGKLIERYSVDKFKSAELVNRIKIKANLDISERRLPQDGRILIKSGETKMDLRVSIIPTLTGEKIVLRLLGTNAEHLKVEELGFTEKDLSDYLVGTKKHFGIILISGPTGSGKTTTLYATLKLLNQPHVNIMTVEDPVEYTLNGVNQVQVKEDIGLTFASTLRSFLRQDPDIIMVGEIRDKETADLAIRASLTGHLVLSTIHTNSAWGTINRLKDMGVPAFLIADTLNTTVAQRLVRLLCPHCKQLIAVEEMAPEIQKYVSEQRELKTYKANGCSHCFYVGYSGRKAIYEVINVNEDVKEFIKNDRTPVGINNKIAYTSLQENALLLFKTGLTSWEEIYPILIS